MGAGGMGRGRSGLSMSERVALTADRPDGECPARHCWVGDPADRSGQKRPGLLVEWRQEAGRWHGRVVYAAQLRPGVWAVVEEWVDEVMLTPA